MVQVYNFKRPPSTAEKFSQAFTNVSKSVGENVTQKMELDAENKEIKDKYGIDLSPFKDPKQRQDVFLEQLKIENKHKEMGEKLKQNKQILSNIEKERGLPEGSLNAYVSDPNMAERVTRPAKTNISEKPIEPEQLDKIRIARSNPEWKGMDEQEKYEYLTDLGVSRANAEAEAKITGQKKTRESGEFEKSYALHEDFIRDTTNTYKGFETEMKPRLLQMQSMDADKIIGPTAAVFLESLNIPLGALEDPSSELYNKLSQDLLKGLPETYGSRILKVEVDNFLKTIPTLMNSVDGRRMIASNMLKLGEMKEVYYKEMRRQQKEYLESEKKLPKDFEQEIFDQVKPQIDRINNQFVKMAQITKVPEGKVPYFDSNDNIVFVPNQPKAIAWANKNGQRIW